MRASQEYSEVVDKFLREQKDILSDERKSVVDEALSAAKDEAGSGIKDQRLGPQAELQFHTQFLLLSEDPKIVRGLNKKLAEAVTETRKAIDAAQAVVECFEAEHDLIVTNKLYDYDTKANERAVDRGIVLCKYYLQSLQILHFHSIDGAEVEKLKQQRQPFEEAVEKHTGAFIVRTLKPFEKLVTLSNALSSVQVNAGNPVFDEAKKLEDQWMQK